MVNKPDLFKSLPVISGPSMLKIQQLLIALLPLQELCVCVFRMDPKQLLPASFINFTCRVCASVSVVIVIVAAVKWEDVLTDVLDFAV